MPIKSLFSTPGSLLSLALLISLIGLSWWSIYLVRAPQAKPATAPLTEFSAERAISYVRQIAREPHAMGTLDHARVRTYLLKSLSGLGLQPQVQETTVTGPMTSSVSMAPSGAMFRVSSRAGYVYNVMARLKGTQPGKAVLLLAHYDSQPNALGAGDDGAGVAAILETIRAIRRRGPLQHDLIILFTDGEEQGLFGAKAFLRHPWAKDVGFVINLEGRGNSGPSMTFELSTQNGWIVEQLGQAAPYPFASSLAYEVYRNLPNDTDFTIFREAGYAGINSAFLDGFVHYHKLTDSPKNLSLNSLQHHGDNLLALTQHFGNGSLDQVKAPDKVFFNIAGNWLVQYPAGLDWLWMVLLTIAFGVVFVLGLRRKELMVGQVFGSFLLSLVILLLVGGFAFGTNLLIYQQLPLTHFFNGSYGSATFAVAFTLLSVGVFGLLIRLSLRWFSPLSLVLGAYGLIYVLTLTNFIFVPTVTYVFLFPLLSALIGLLIVLWQTHKQTEARPVHALILLVAAGPTLFILLPVVQLLFVTFDLQLPVVPVLVLGLVLALLLPVWLLVETGLSLSGWRNLPALSILSFVLGCVVAGIAIRREEPTADQPLHSQVAYFMNANAKRAVWTSYGLLITDDWNRQFFSTPTIGKLTEIVPASSSLPPQDYLKSPASLITAALPIAKIQSDTIVGSIRQLTIVLHSPRGAANLEAVLFPGVLGRITSIRANTEQLPIKSQQTAIGPAYDLLFLGLPVTKQITLTVDLKVGSPLGLMLYDQSIGLPPELVQRPRPAYVIPEQGRVSNLTVIGKTYQF